MCIRFLKEKRHYKGCGRKKNGQHQTYDSPCKGRAFFLPRIINRHFRFLSAAFYLFLLSAAFYRFFYLLLLPAAFSPSL
jgi:hypothetical protein